MLQFSALKSPLRIKIKVKNGINMESKYSDVKQVLTTILLKKCNIRSSVCVKDRLPDSSRSDVVRNFLQQLQ